MTSAFRISPLVASFAFSFCLLCTTAGRSEEAATLHDAEEAGIMQAQEHSQEAIAKDLSPSLKPIYELGEDDRKLPRIKVDAWVDQKDLTYTAGDTIIVSVSPKKDAYITILNVGSSGRVAVIFPNYFQRETMVKGGSLVRIPAKNAKWQMEVAGPAGVDLIQVIASRKPLTLKELEKLAGADEKNPVLTLGRSAAETAKDLSPQLKHEAEAGDPEPKFGIRNVLVRVTKS